MSSKPTITLDQQESIVAFLDEPGWEGMKVVMKEMVNGKLQEFVNMDLQGERASQALLLEKARLEGASWLMNSVVQYLEKTQQSKED